MEFEQALLQFESGRHENVFAFKNNKTVSETLRHRRYANLLPIILPHYQEHQNKSLGSFLLERKQCGDTIYRDFLNPYGDLIY